MGALGREGGDQELAASGLHLGRQEAVAGRCPGKGAARVPARAGPTRSRRNPAAAAGQGARRARSSPSPRRGCPAGRRPAAGMDREDQRLAWLDGHGVEDRLAAELREHPFDEIELAHGDAAAEEEHVRAEAALADEIAQRLHPVGRDAQRSKRRPRVAPAASRKSVLESRSCPGAGTVSGGTTSSPVVSTATDGRAVDGHLAVAVGGEEGERSRGEAGARGQQGIARLQDLPPAADVLARLPGGGRSPARARRPSPRPGHAVGARGHRRAGHDADRGRGEKREAGRIAGGDGAGDGGGSAGGTSPVTA